MSPRFDTLQVAVPATLYVHTSPLAEARLAAPQKAAFTWTCGMSRTDSSPNHRLREDAQFPAGVSKLSALLRRDVSAIGRK
jgi:hypothetical protein